MSVIETAKRGRSGPEECKARDRAFMIGAALLLPLTMMMQGPPGALAAETGKVAATPSDKPYATKKNASDTGQGMRDLVGHGGPVHAIQLNRDKTRALTGSFDYAMMLWDISGDKPKVLRRFDKHDGWVKAVSFLPGGKRALSAGGGQLWIWDLETGKAIHTFNGHRAEISALAVSSNGKWAATASSDRTVRLWNLETLKPGPVLKGHRGPVNGVAFSSDDTRLYTASYDGTLRSWASETGEFKRIVYRHGFGINTMQRLPGGDQLVFGALNGKALIVDGQTGERVHEFEGLEGPFLAIAVQEKPGLLSLSGFQKRGGDVVGVIRVYRLGDWAPIEEYEDPRGPIWAMDFGPIGATIYYGSKDDHVIVWQVTPRKPFETISGPVPRRFEVKKTAGPGELQFARKCSLCHTLTSDGGNRAGPTLYKVFGRRVGTLPGYPYSDALKKSDIIWSAKTIELLFGLGPDHYLPGTKMPLQRIADPKKRDALIAYLKIATEGGGGTDTPKGKEAEELKDKTGSKE